MPHRFGVYQIPPSSEDRFTVMTYGANTLGRWSACSTVVLAESVGSCLCLQIFVKLVRRRSMCNCVADPDTMRKVVPLSAKVLPLFPDHIVSPFLPLRAQANCHILVRAIPSVTSQNICGTLAIGWAGAATRDTTRIFGFRWVPASDRPQSTRSKHRHSSALMRINARTA